MFPSLLPMLLKFAREISGQRGHLTVSSLTIAALLVTLPLPSSTERNRVSVSVLKGTELRLSCENPDDAVVFDWYYKSQGRRAEKLEPDAVSDEFHDLVIPRRPKREPTTAPTFASTGATTNPGVQSSSTSSAKPQTSNTAAAAAAAPQSSADPSASDAVADTKVRGERSTWNDGADPRKAATGGAWDDAATPRPTLPPFHVIEGGGRTRLHVTKADFADEGLYECRGRTNSSFNQHFRVTVVEKPTCSIVPLTKKGFGTPYPANGSISLSTGDKIKFLCVVNARKSKVVKVAWFRDGDAKPAVGIDKRDKLTNVTNTGAGKTFTMIARHSDHGARLLCRADPPGWPKDDLDTLSCSVGPLDVKFGPLLSSPEKQIFYVDLPDQMIKFRVTSNPKVDLHDVMGEILPYFPEFNGTRPAPFVPPVQRKGMHLFASFSPIPNGYEFHVDVVNPVMPRLPMWYRRIRLRISLRKKLAIGGAGLDQVEHILVVSLRRNNTDIVPKDPRGILIAPASHAPMTNAIVEKKTTRVVYRFPGASTLGIAAVAIFAGILVIVICALSYTHCKNVRWRQPKMANIAVQVEGAEVDGVHLAPNGNLLVPEEKIRIEDDDDDDAAVPFLRINGSLPNSGFSLPTSAATTTTPSSISEATAVHATRATPPPLWQPEVVSFDIDPLDLTPALTLPGVDSASTSPPRTNGAPTARKESVASESVSSVDELPGESYVIHTEYESSTMYFKTRRSKIAEAAAAASAADVSIHVGNVPDHLAVAAVPYDGYAVMSSLKPEETAERRTSKALFLDR